MDGHALTEAERSLMNLLSATKTVMENGVKRIDVNVTKDPLRVGLQSDEIVLRKTLVKGKNGVRFIYFQTNMVAYQLELSLRRYHVVLHQITPNWYPSQYLTCYNLHHLRYVDAEPL